MTTLGDRLVHHRRSTTVGRSSELAELRELLAPGGPVVFLVSGLGGMGKSTLLQMFSADAEATGARVVALDCRTIEPTEGALLAAIGEGMGAAGMERAAVLDALRGAHQVVLVLDALEHLSLLDTWLRQDLIPSLPDSCRVLVASRQLPLSAWGASGAEDAPVRAMALGPLPADDSRSLLRARGVVVDDIEPLIRFTRGHPLALSIAAQAATTMRSAPLTESAVPAVIEALTAIYLTDLDDDLLRALEAASVVRRLTIPLLAAMVPSLDAPVVHERMRHLPVVEATSDGLFVQESFQQAVAARLRSIDPARAGALRRSAWRELRHEAARAGHATLWRSTADMLFLVENPVVREAFFPSGALAHVVERARRADGDDITRLIRAEEPDLTAEWALGWWARRPEIFSVARSRTGAVDGICALVRYEAGLLRELRGDVVGAAWCRHLARRPLARGRSALLLFRWLSRGAGEMPSTAQAAMWLDIKRLYMELRPGLDRLYTVVRDLEFYDPIVTPLGFRPIEQVRVGDDLLTACVLDFGPGSVDGWLAGLVGAELAEGDDEAATLGLSPLEGGVWSHLGDNLGRAVPRVELIEAVWGTTYSGGSNVVDAVVRTLRAKLGARADDVETVRGVGYRRRS